MGKACFFTFLRTNQAASSPSPTPSPGLPLLLARCRSPADPPSEERGRQDSEWSEPGDAAGAAGAGVCREEAQDGRGRGTGSEASLRIASLVRRELHPAPQVSWKPQSVGGVGVGVEGGGKESRFFWVSGLHEPQGKRKRTSNRNSTPPGSSPAGGSEQRRRVRTLPRAADVRTLTRQR